MCCKNIQQNQGKENADNHRKWQYVFKKEEKDLT